MSKSVIVIGICAMHNKSSTFRMQEIIGRLSSFDHFKVTVFEEKIILQSPIEDWPFCDCLLAYYSNGFPLNKAIMYADLRNPFVLNDLNMQREMQDRLKIYKILKENEIPCPHLIYTKSGQITETDDAIEIDGKILTKPFVEKPISADDHNINIYLPPVAGGGCQKLFRKIGDTSSIYCEDSRIRKESEYLYEEFLQTEGLDIKVYAIGPGYAHAEARKSPMLDGKVKRNKAGKEIRYPVILSSSEKIIAQKICLAFKQTVCGFDLLRSGGNSYVCDVNGFSLVKNSQKYYDDATAVIGGLILNHFNDVVSFQFVSHLPEDIPFLPTTTGTVMELRSIISIIRHADRTPKQKVKMVASNSIFFDFFNKHADGRKNEIKLKKPNQLQELLDIVRLLLLNYNSDEIAEPQHKLEHLKNVLEMYGFFSGFNRKVQMKKRNNIIFLVMKWGGELTSTGRKQAESLGRSYRLLYPSGHQADTLGFGFLRLHSTYRHDLKIYASDEGRVQLTAAAFTKGLLDLEGKLAPIFVQMVKSTPFGLLDSDSSSYQTPENIRDMMDQFINLDKTLTKEDYKKYAPTGSSAIIEAMNLIVNPKKLCYRVFELIGLVVARLNNFCYSNQVLFDGEGIEYVMRRWSKLHKDFYNAESDSFVSSKIPDIYDCIQFDLQHNQKIFKSDFSNELYVLSEALTTIVTPQEFGISKNEKLEIGRILSADLLKKLKTDIETSHQTDDGYTRLDVRYTSNIASPHRFVRSRYYFTTERIIQSFLNCIKYDPLLPISDKIWKSAVSYLETISIFGYLSQLTVMMYEDSTKPLDDAERFHVEIHVSPGISQLEYSDSQNELIATAPIQSESDISYNKSITDSVIPPIFPLFSGVRSLRTLHNRLTYQTFDEFLKRNCREKS